MIKPIERDLLKVKMRKSIISIKITEKAEGNGSDPNKRMLLPVKQKSMGTGLIVGSRASSHPMALLSFPL